MQRNVGKIIIKEVATFDGNQGKEYRQIIDIASKGGRLLSLEEYVSNRAEIVKYFRKALPAASNMHCSYAPPDATFADAAHQYGSRYAGYHVSEDLRSGEKILFPLPSRIWMNQQLVNPVSMTNIAIIIMLEMDGKPTLAYEYDPKRKETLIHINDINAIQIIAFPTESGWYRFTSVRGFEKASGPDSYRAFYLWRSNRNWNGILSLGRIVRDFTYSGESIGADHRPSYHLGILTVEKLQESQITSGCSV
ncbi:MAG: hypothetical protein QXN37_04050 [Candidatus Anstonellaceae archaeon]